MDRATVIAIGSKLGVAENDLDGWYKIDEKSFTLNDGDALIAKYGSLWGILSNVLSERSWQAFRFGKVPRGYWTSLDHQREFLEYVSTQLGMKKGDLDEWYGRNATDLIPHGGAGVLYLYGNSLAKLLMALFPGHPWDVSRFSSRPRSYWSSLENQKKFMDQIGVQLGVRDNLDGWYSISSSSLLPLGAGSLLTRYNGSLSKLLAAVYPNHPWKVDNFSKRSITDSLESQRKFMDELGEKLGVRELDGWYSITTSDVMPLGARGILRLYNNSFSKLLAAVYPDHPWNVAKFAKRPQRYWSSLENQKKFMDELGETIGLRDLNGWYSINMTDLLPLGAGSILELYGRSLSKLLATVYPDHPWDISKFTRRPANFWSSLANQKKFMDDLGKEIGIRDLDGWYSMTMRTMLPLGAGSILALYSNSLSQLLATVYPNHPWDLSKFSKRPLNYWSSIDNQRKFMDELGAKIGIRSEDDFDKWYEQSVDLFQGNGGYGLLAHYNMNLPKLLAAVYPNFDWQLWKFPRRINQVLQNEVELDKLFTSLEKALEIRRPEDWYRVTTEQLTALKVPTFYKTIEGGLATLLSKRYPNIQWDLDAFFGRGFRRATQRWLAAMLTDLFPSETVLVDHSHPDLHFQLDVFFPELNLAFEYQGAQHYEQLSVYGNVSDQMVRDTNKVARCLEHGITLIAVPFWWNKKRPALLAAILAERPDLFKTKLSDFVEEARRGSMSAA